jgi:hypothetical protein
VECRRAEMNQYRVSAMACELSVKNFTPVKLDLYESWHFSELRKKQENFFFTDQPIKHRHEKVGFGGPDIRRQV